MCNVHGAKLGSSEQEEKEEKNTIIEVPIIKPSTKATKKTSTTKKTSAKVKAKAIVIPSPEELRNLRNSYYT